MADYEIKIPGMRDIFSWNRPPPPPPSWAKDMYRRARERTSPVPKPLQWIPSVINALDDAQDLLFSVAWLAKPLLKRVGSKFIPFIGWGLLALDAINLINGTLGLAMQPCATKPEILRAHKRIKPGVKNAEAAFEKFVKPGGWRGHVGFAIQAAQASETIFGRGLQIGPIMGTLSDVWWLGVRSMFEEGKRVHIKTPPPDDLIGKAARHFSQAHQQVFARDILTSEEHKMLLMANRLAASILYESGLTITDERAEIMNSAPVPVYLPWRAESIQGLQEEGVPMDETVKPFALEGDTPITYSQAITDAIDNYYDWSMAIKDALSSQEEKAIWYMLHKEAAEETIETLTEINWDEYTDYYYDQNVATRLAGCDFQVDENVSTDALFQLHMSTVRKAITRGNEFPTCEDWLDTALEQGVPWKQKRHECQPTSGTGSITGYAFYATTGNVRTERFLPGEIFGTGTWEGKYETKSVTHMNRDVKIILIGLDNPIYRHGPNPYSFCNLEPG